MSDALRTRFRAQFLQTAQARVRKVLNKLEEEGGAGVVCADLHSLAGEAAMTGFAEIAALARIGELAARSWRDGSSDAARVECERTIQEVTRQLEALAKDPPRQ